MSYAKGVRGVDVIDRNDYYAFGMNHPTNDIGAPVFRAGGDYVNYKYNGQELQETGLYAMDWRHYMPDVGRFTGMDALSELYESQTPYHFGLNNPANYSDPTGLYTVSQGGNRIDLDPSEFRAFHSSFSGGGHGIGSMFNEVQTNTDSYSFTIAIDHVIVQGRGSAGTWNSGSNFAYNLAVLESGINKARTNWNFQQAHYTLIEANTETEIGKSFGALENFLFRDIPLQFAGGALVSAGWKAIGAGKYLSGVVENVYAVILQKCWYPLLISINKGIHTKFKTKRSR